MASYSNSGCSSDSELDNDEIADPIFIANAPLLDNTADDSNLPDEELANVEKTSSSDDVSTDEEEVDNAVPVVQNPDDNDDVDVAAESDTNDVDVAAESDTNDFDDENDAVEPILGDAEEPIVDAPVADPVDSSSSESELEQEEAGDSSLQIADSEIANDPPDSSKTLTPGSPLFDQGTEASSPEPSDIESSKPKAADIFGDELTSDDDSGAEPDKTKPVAKTPPTVEIPALRLAGTARDTEPEPVGRFAGEEESDEEQQEQEPQETVIDVEMPKIKLDLGQHQHFVKFPNFLSVEPRPFDPETYEDEADEDDALDEEGRQRLKLKVENTIRWRYHTDEQGNAVRQSNSKVVRWSDGRPHSTDSATHRKMTLSMADRSNRAQKVKVLSVVGKNPEFTHQETLKREEEKSRANARREALQRRIKERQAHRGLNASYLEDDQDDDENSVSIAALKRRFKQDTSKRFEETYSDSESDDNNARVLQSSESEEEETSKKKKKVIEDSDED